MNMDEQSCIMISRRAWLRLVLVAMIMSPYASVSLKRVRGSFTNPNAYRIDIHSHFVPPFYREYLTERNIQPGGYPVSEWNASMHLAHMDAFSIQTSVVSITTPGARCEPDDFLESRLLARRLNEYAYYELVQKYPGRFQFWATVTLPDVEGSIAETTYALEKLKAVGVFLEAVKFDTYLGDPSLDAFFQLLNVYEAVVFVHPGSSNAKEMRGIPPAVVDYTLDTTRAALNLVFSNMTRKYPNITYVFAHSGGFLPFVAHRIAYSPTAQVLAGKDSDILTEFRKFYFDSALASSDSSLSATISFAGADRILYGSEFPCGYSAMSRFTSILDSFPLPESERLGINRTNAESLFPVLTGDQNVRRIEKYEALRNDSESASARFIPFRETARIRIDNSEESL